MPIELWLNFTDENGEPKRVLVEGEKFAIGRTPDNDLQIPVSNLSRQHAQIQRFADVFVISDLGSSNGTALNDENLEKPLALKNGDKLDLGGLEMEVEIVSDKAGADDKQGGGGNGSSGSASDEEEDEPASSGSTASAASAGASASTNGSSLSPLLFIAAPVFGIIILLLLGGLFLISRGNNGIDIVKTNKNTDFVYTSNKDEGNDLPTNKESGTLGKNNSPTPANSTPPTNNSNVPPTPTPTGEIDVPTPPVGETAKIEKSSNSFLRRIAQNDPKAFLTDKQISLISSRITSFKDSKGLAENIRNAKKNASQIQELANSKDLKPQFLANAALTKLGNQSGDVVATAREMLEQLSAISKPFGNESADDNLLIIAAYSSNTSGESLQTTAGVFTKNNPGKSARTIRSIWFFKENGKLSDPQFEFALRFLAIGTITQNPKDFNVQAEALTF